MNLLVRTASLALLLAAAQAQAAISLQHPAAAAAPDGAARAQYNRDRAACLAGDSGEDRDTCLREAAAALQQAARDAATPDAGPAPDYPANALARCQVHRQAEDRLSCELRMRAPAQGSVQAGGLLREAIETVFPPADTPSRAP